jgi:hypothetical protein
MASQNNEDQNSSVTITVPAVEEAKKKPRSRIAQFFETKNNESNFFDLPVKYADPKLLDKILTNEHMRHTDVPSSINDDASYPIASYSAEWVCVALFIFYVVLFSLLRYPEVAFRLDDPDLSYPLLPSRSPWWATLLVNMFVPLGVCIIHHLLLIRNLRDLHHLILGFALSLASCMYLTTFLWLILGGLPPNFIQLCQPDLEKVATLTNQRTAFSNQVLYFFPSEICTQNVITVSTVDNSMIGSGFLTNIVPAFPSSRSSTAFAGWLYAALYINGKLGTWHLNLGHFWKLLVFIIPIQIATYISASGILDYSHTYLQVFIGILIGITCGITGYLSKYMGISSHIPSIFYWEHLGKYIVSKNTVKTVEPEPVQRLPKSPEIQHEQEIEMQDQRPLPIKTQEATIPDRKVPAPVLRKVAEAADEESYDGGNDINDELTDVDLESDKNRKKSCKRKSSSPAAIEDNEISENRSVKAIRDFRRYSDSDSDGEPKLTKRKNKK